MTGEALLEVQGLSKFFDGVKALDDFSSVVNRHEIVGLIGPNGAGKTTLFNILTGFLAPDSGQVFFKGTSLVGCPPHGIASLGVSRTFQDLRLIHRLSVLDNLLLSFRDQAGESLGGLFFRWPQCRHQENENTSLALSLLESVGLKEKDGEPTGDLSYGQQKLLSLLCGLASGAELLLLDEPVAGIAPVMIAQLLSVIRGLPNKGRTVMLIEHNIEAVMAICHRVIFMDAGIKVSEGDPVTVRNDPRVIAAYLD